MKRLLALLLIALMSVMSASTFAQSTPTVRVGSELFTESIILAQMIRVALEDAGIPTQDNTQLGGTDTNRSALVNNITDVYVEYTGTALFNFFEDVSWFNLEGINRTSSIETYSTVTQLDAVLNGLVWLRPAIGSNAYGLVVTRSFAEANALSTMSDFADYVNEGGAVLLVSNEEFAARPDGLPVFEAIYGFDLEGAQMLVINEATTALAQQAVSTGVNGINVGMAFTTDALITAYDLVLLEDDLGAQPLFQPAPVFRREVLETYPEIIGILNPIFATLDNETLRTLNGQVDIDGKTPEEVALNYLLEKGFIGDTSDTEGSAGN